MKNKREELLNIEKKPNECVSVCENQAEGIACKYRLNTKQKVYRFVKTIVDFLIALVALCFLIPLFIIVAIAIKIDSPGPVFFVQKRIGKNGKLFNCIKFRSMFIEARHDVAGYEYKDASAYVTKVGAFIRKFSIDELPQIFNILTFKMSLIGYRPSQENETELNDARAFYDMYQVRPGVTGWAQINGRDVLAAKPRKKAEFDAYYLQHFSLWMDIKIFVLTLVKVCKSDDVVEGVIEEEQENSCVKSVKTESFSISSSKTKGAIDNIEEDKQEVG